MGTETSVRDAQSPIRQEARIVTPSGFERFAAAVKLAANLGVLVGVIAGILGLVNGVQSLRTSANAAKLNSYPQLRQIVDEDAAVAPLQGEFLKHFSGDDGQASLAQLAKDSGGASNAYYSDNLRDLRTIARHYEWLGALVKHGYIDFDTAYDVIPFPAEIWTQTESFRQYARTKDWSGGKPLPDFWKNFEYLHDLYQARRSKLTAR